MEYSNRLCTTAIGGRRGRVQFRDIADVVPIIILGDNRFAPGESF